MYTPLFYELLKLIPLTDTSSTIVNSNKGSRTPTTPHPSRHIEHRGSQAQGRPVLSPDTSVDVWP